MTPDAVGVETMQRQPQCGTVAWLRDQDGFKTGLVSRCANEAVPGMTSCSSCLEQRFSRPKLKAVESTP